MAENAGGRLILSGRDAQFLAALRAEYTNADALIGEVMPAAPEEGGAADLTGFLRERGYHYLAGDEVEPAAETE